VEWQPYATLKEVGTSLRIQNLDQWFTSLYTYFKEKGFACIVTSRVVNLLTLGFTIFFSGFLLLYVDWTYLRTECAVGLYKLNSVVAHSSKPPGLVPTLESIPIYNVKYRLQAFAFTFQYAPPTARRTAARATSCATPPTPPRCATAARSPTSSSSSTSSSSRSTGPGAWWGPC
jgi:hypothetical protein